MLFKFYKIGQDLLMFFEMLIVCLVINKCMFEFQNTCSPPKYDFWTKIWTKIYFREKSLPVAKPLRCALYRTISKIVKKLYVEHEKFICNFRIWTDNILVLSVNLGLKFSKTFEMTLSLPSPISHSVDSRPTWNRVIRIGVAKYNFRCINLVE